MSKSFRVLIVVVGLLALAVGLAIGWFGPRLLEKKTEAGHASAPAEEEHEAGLVKLKPEQIEHAGVQFAAPVSAAIDPEVQCFGVLQEDPADSFTVRASAPGTLQVAGDHSWPNLGDEVADNATVGQLQPRIITADEIALDTQRTALQAQLTSAQSDFNTAKAALSAAQASYSRLKELNAQDQNVSNRAVEEALAKVQTEEARVVAAEKSLQQSTDALKSVQSKQTHLAPIPLVAIRGGQVVEVFAHAGEAIESGQPVLRVARFKHLVVAVTVLPGDPVASDVKEAKIVPLGGGASEGAAPIFATRLGNAEITDPKTKGRVLLFRLDQPASGELRPEAPVIAHLRAQGKSIRGVVVPESAVVRYQGKAWIYVADEKEKAAGEFLRKEIALDHPTTTADGARAWLMTEKLDAEEQLVTQGASSLLSTEIFTTFGGAAE